MQDISICYEHILIRRKCFESKVFLEEVNVKIITKYVSLSIYLTARLRHLAKFQH